MVQSGLFRSLRAFCHWFWTCNLWKSHKWAHNRNFTKNVFLECSQRPRPRAWEYSQDCVRSSTSSVPVPPLRGWPAWASVGTHTWLKEPALTLQKAPETFPSSPRSACPKSQGYQGKTWFPGAAIRLHFSNTNNLCMPSAHVYLEIKINISFKRMQA